jgi:DNA-directed RNA polymerase specialized sigma24 family protein
MARVAFVICGDPEATRDAVQSAWSIAWRRMRTLRNPDQVGPWLIAIAANEARQLVRIQRRRPVVDISDTLQADEGGDPGETIGLVDLQRALAHLDPDDRRLLGKVLRPYPEVVGPFNVFHLAAGGLVIYAAAMLRVARPVHAVA